MDKNLLSLLLLILAAGVWLTIILINIIFNRERKKISIAARINEIGEKRCILADELIRMINQYQNKYLIFIIIFSLIVLTQTFLKGISLAKINSKMFFDFDVLLNSIDPVYFFSWLAALGCYLIMRQLRDYSLFTKQRCDELKNKKEH